VPITCRSVTELKLTLAVINDTAVGEYTSETIYDDENVEQLDSISPDALHRAVDLKVLKADEEGELLNLAILFSPSQVRNPT